MAQLTASLTQGRIDVPESVWASPGRNGLYYSKYGPGQSLAAVPLYFAGQAAMHFAPQLPSSTLEVALLTLLNPLILGLVAVATALLALEMGLSLRVAVTSALLLTFGSCTAYYAKTFFSEPLQTLCILLSAVSAIRYRKWSCRKQLWFSGIWLATAVLVKPTCLLVTPILTIYVGLRHKPYLPLGMPVAIALSSLMGYNYYRFDNPLTFGYGQETFVHVPAGAMGLLFSPGCGLCFYAPALCLGFVYLKTALSERAREAWLLMALFWVWWLIFSFWPVWDGNAWGPRYLLPGLPGLAILAANGLRSKPSCLVASIMTLAILQQAPALFVSPGWYEYAIKVDIQKSTGRPFDFQRDSSKRNWEIAYMPWKYQAARLLKIVMDNRPIAASAKDEIARVATKSNDQVVLNEGLLNRFNFQVVDIWPVYLSCLGHPFIGFTLWFVGAMTALLSLLGLYRSVVHTPI